MANTKKKSGGSPRARKAATVSKSRATGKLSVVKGGAKENAVLTLRHGLGVSRKVFSRLSQFSERAIADWERGEALGGASRQRMIDLERLRKALSSVIEPDYIGEWLQTPNDSFDGLKPLEVIERGEIDRLWRMIYLLESGVPG